MTQFHWYASFLSYLDSLAIRFKPVKSWASDMGVVYAPIGRNFTGQSDNFIGCTD